MAESMAERSAEGEMKSKEGIYERKWRNAQILFAQQAQELDGERAWRKKTVEKLDQTVAEKKSLVLKFEAERKADRERFEAEIRRKEEDSKQIALRFEAVRKADRERFEAERKTDRERFEEERKADRERFEAERKADRERFEAERKQSSKSFDLERREKIELAHRVELLKLDLLKNKSPIVAKAIFSDSFNAAMSQLWTFSWRPEMPSESIFVICLVWLVSDFLSQGHCCCCNL